MDFSSLASLPMMTHYHQEFRSNLSGKLRNSHNINGTEKQLFCLWNLEISLLSMIRLCSTLYESLTEENSQKALTISGMSTRLSHQTHQILNFETSPKCYRCSNGKQITWSKSTIE